MHDNQSVRTDLRQKSPNLLLAHRHIAIAEEKVDAAIYLHLQAGLIAQFNPLRQFRLVNSLPRILIDLGVKFTTHNFAPAICLQTFRNPKRADTAERARLDHQFRLDGRDQRAQKFQHFNLRGH